MKKNKKYDEVPKALKNDKKKEKKKKNWKKIWLVLIIYIFPNYFYPK